MGPLFQFLKNPSHSWAPGRRCRCRSSTAGACARKLGAASAGYDEAVDRYNQSIVAR